jgi:sec-independent protein translocase protein TatA
MIGTQDLVVALALILFFFGAKRLPEMAGSLGKSMREFKKAVSSEDESAVQSTPPVGPAEASPTPPRACAACQGPLEADWKHCPRCGTTVVSPEESRPA